MPASTRNSQGVRSLNELFAMKKNMRFETKLAERMDSITRDYWIRREGLKQDIRTVYNDLQDIRLSTGYSLDVSLLYV